MSSNYTKIASNQAGVFNRQHNLVDFHIPPNVYDFSKSYVELNCYLDVDDPDDTQPEGIFNFTGSVNNAVVTGGTAGANDEIVSNIALVKNAHLRNEAVGVLENIRRVDRLRHSLFNYTKTDEMIANENWNSLGCVMRADTQGGSNFTELHGFGESQSLNRENILRIPLSHIWSLGSVRAYDGNRMGMTTAHLELQPQTVEITQMLGDLDPLWGDGGRNEMLDIPETALNNILITVNPYPDIGFSPFWVGQKINISGTGDGGQGDLNDEIRTIVGIEYDITGTYTNNIKDRLILTLNTALPTVTAGRSIESITVKGNDATAEIVFSHINLVLNVPSNPSPSSSITYTTHTLEEDYGNGRTNFRKVYELEPECKNVFLVFGNGIFSKDPAITTYRFLIDNEEVSDKEVDIGTPEHRDLIMTMLDNGGDPIRNLQEHYYTDKGEGLGFNYNNLTRRIIGCPTPMTNETKLLHVEINSGGVEDIALYKEVVRTI